MTTIPPPPSYPPNGGMPQTWWEMTSTTVWTDERMAAAEAAHLRLAQSMDDLSRSIVETPEDRRQRVRSETRAADDERRAELGETPAQRALRHQAEDRAEQRWARRAATRIWKARPDERSRRFRRWCILTGLSASAGYSMGLVQLTSTLPTGVATLIAFPATYWLDLRLRGGIFNFERISDLRDARRIAIVLMTRIPVASVLASILQLDALLAASGRLFH